jgi:hypothetical protein
LPSTTTGARRGPSSEAASRTGRRASAVPDGSDIEGSDIEGSDIEGSDIEEDGLVLARPVQHLPTDLQGHRRSSSCSNTVAPLPRSTMSHS